MKRARTAKTAVFGVGAIALAYLGIGIAVSFKRHGLFDGPTVLRWWAPPPPPPPVQIWVPGGGVPGMIT